MRKKQRRQKRQSSDYHALAKERGFRWIGKKLPPTTHHKTLWECSQEHQWKAAYTSIRQGRGCRACAGQSPKTEDDYHALAEEREIHWVGDKLPPNTHHRTLWECRDGHRWKARYGNIQQGGGCPVCAILYRSRRR